MPRPTASQGRTGRPPVTSRKEILVAAREIIDRDGWEKLTIRRLAADMGIGATTLYHHVRDRQDLLVLLLNAFVEQVPQPELPDDPRDRIVMAATTMHDALASWPWTAEVLTTDGYVNLLGESALWMVEAIVAGAVDAGCTPTQAVDVFRGIWYYTAGEILVRAHSARRPAQAERATGPDGFLGHVDAAELPQLAALGDEWPVLAARDTYSDGLSAFVEGLLAHAAKT